MVLVLPLGWALFFAARSSIVSKRPLILALTIAFSAGGISLLMFWVALLNIPLSYQLIINLYRIVMAVGWGVYLRFRIPGVRLFITDNDDTDSPNRFRIWAMILLFGICAAVIFNAVYLPFYRDDALGIYAPFAAEITSTQSLAPITPQRNLYELYPQLMSMNFAFTYLAAGWENPYAAKLINALLSLGCLPAIYLLAQQMFRRPAISWTAVFVFALVPDFTNWASAGYVDLPMIFFYTLGVAFAWSLLKDNRDANAILAGMMFGLAAWTKNAALVGITIFSLFTLLNLMLRQISVKHALLAFVMIIVVTAPWYGRNLILAGTLTPDTVWVEDARQTLCEVFILLTLPQNYGVSGVMMTGGLVWAVWQSVNGRYRVESWFLLLFSLPYYATWFVFASYDPRFVMLFLPFLAVMSGMMLVQLWDRLPGQRVTAAIVVMVIATGLTLMVMWHGVDYKRALLAKPTMTHEMKLEMIEQAQ